MRKADKATNYLLAPIINSPIPYDLLRISLLGSLQQARPDVKELAPLLFGRGGVAVLSARTTPFHPSKGRRGLSWIRNCEAVCGLSRFQGLA